MLSYIMLIAMFAHFTRAMHDTRAQRLKPKDQFLIGQEKCN